MTPPARAGAAVLAAPAPVLIFDTCSVLDLARATERDPPNVAAALALLARRAAPGRLHLFVPDLVPGEWQKNIDAASAREGDRGHRAFDATWRSAVALGQPLPTPDPPLLPTLLSALRRLSERFLGACTVLAREPDAMSWAIDRVAAGEKPSKKGGVKDCHIVGHALTLARSLGSGFPHSVLFVSSNTEDFAHPNLVDVHPTLAPHFASAGLRYSPSLADAAAKLRATGELPP